MRKDLILLILISITFLLNAQSVDIEEVGCKLNTEQLNEINTVIKFELDFYKSIFEIDNVLVDIVIFGDFEEFKKYQSKVSTTSKSNNGFYSSSLQKIIIHKNEKFHKTINHEISHLILRSVVNPVPKWINEGLAELFEYFYVSNGSVVEGIQSNKIKRVNNWITNGQLDIKEFLQLSNKEWSEKNVKPLYHSSSTSYCLVYFLYNEHPHILKKILNELKDGKDTLVAINSIYPSGFTRFNADFSEFIKNINKE